MRATRTILVTLLGALLGTVACTDAGRALIILQNQKPTSGCVIPNSTGSVFIPRGLYDSTAEAGYLLTPLVQNNALPDSTGDVNLRIAQVEGAEVRLTLESGFITGEERLAFDDATAARFSVLTRFTKNFSGTVMPSGGLSSFAFEIIPAALMSEFVRPKLGGTSRMQISAEVTIFGKMGGSGFDSFPFKYAVEVCTGCLEVTVGLCADLPTDFSPSLGGECNPDQDVVTECCTLGDASLRCPAQSTADPGGGDL